MSESQSSATRRMPPGSHSALQSRTPKYTPTEKLGHLTPIRAAACGLGNWLFRCDCTSVVTRVARDVRRAAGRGGMPRCSRSCSGKPAAEAAAT